MTKWETATTNQRQDLRALPECGSSWRNIRRLGQRFDDIDTGLATVFDLSERAGAEISQSSLGCLCVPSLQANRLQP